MFNGRILVLIACLSAGGVTMPPATAQPAARAELEEVVVTARRREESLQDTPVSITAFSGDALERQHIDSLDGIARFTPNLSIDAGTSFSGAASAAAVFIRGIGQVDFTLVTEPGVGIYLDGVYLSQSIGSVLDLIDVERVEVLRGPQGTLFGRNTIGGAISITSRQADDRIHGSLRVTTGRYDRLDVKGDVNIPLTDHLFAKASFATFRRDGFVAAPNTTDGDALGGIDREAGRLALRFEPNERFTASLSADYTRMRDSGVPNVLVDTFDGASLALISAESDPSSPGYVPPPLPLPPPSFIDLFNLLATVPFGEQGGIAGLTPGIVPSPVFGQPVAGRDDIVNIEHGPLYNGSTNDLSSDADVWGVALTLQYDFAGMTAKSITSYRDLEAFAGYDAAAIAQVLGHLADTYDVNQFSQELQVSGMALNDRLNWLLGFYHFEEDGVNLDDVEFSAMRFLSGADIDNRSTAGFAQATIDLTARLSFTAGVRYTDEHKEFRVPDTCYRLPNGPATLFDGTVVTCAQMHSVIDPKYFNPGFLGFVNAPVFPEPGGRYCCIPVSDAGGNLVTLVPGLTPGFSFLPRGTTTRSFSDWTPRFDLSYRWNDRLMTYLSYSEGFKSGGFVQRVLPKTEVPSFDPETVKVYEAGIKWTGWENRLRFGGAAFHTDYNDLQILVNDGIAPVTRNAAAAEIDGFELELAAVPYPGWLLQAGLGYLDARYTELAADQNLSTDLYAITLDSRLVDAPEWSGNAGLQYTHTFAGGGRLIPRLDWSYRSAVYKDALNFPALRQGALHLVDLSLTYASADGRWEASLFGKNITDEAYFVSGFANGLTQGYATVNLGRPAEWGASLTWHFGE